MTDLCYAACARKLLAQRARLYPFPPLGSHRGERV